MIDIPVVVRKAGKEREIQKKIKPLDTKRRKFSKKGRKGSEENQLEHLCLVL